MIELSVITVCKNEINSIEKTIQSVINQSERDKFEYIIIDGNSNDGTLDIISKYKDKIDIIISENDSGIFEAMNKGIKLSNGKYINFMNAGDYYINDNVIKLFLNQNNGAEFIFGDIIIEYKNGFRFRRKYFINNLKSLLYFDSLSHQASFIKKSLFKRIGLYSTQYKIISDYDWSLKALFKYNCSYQYLQYPISFFNLYGVSNIKKHQELHHKERTFCQSQYYTQLEIAKYQKYRFFYDIYYKKFRYLYYMIRSVLSRRYLYGK